MIGNFLPLRLSCSAQLPLSPSSLGVIERRNKGRKEGGTTTATANALISSASDRAGSGCASCACLKGYMRLTDADTALAQRRIDARIGNSEWYQRKGKNNKRRGSRSESEMMTMISR